MQRQLLVVLQLGLQLRGVLSASVIGLRVTTPAPLPEDQRPAITAALVILIYLALLVHYLLWHHLVGGVETGGVVSVDDELNPAQQRSYGTWNSLAQQPASSRFSNFLRRLMQRRA